jgi:hypothetical protein
LKLTSLSVAPARRVRIAFLAVGVSAVIAGAWVGLTAWTGKTYHLAPVLAAAAPGYVARFAGWPSRSRAAVLGLAVVGGGAVGGGWSAIVAAGIEPTATLVHGQPGGVLVEVVVGALLGVVLGTRQLRREGAELPGERQQRGRNEQGLGGSRAAGRGGQQSGDQ